jgi:hypothetical protein
VLEIDPDARMLRLHDAVPAEAAGLARLPMRHHGTILALETGFDTGAARGREWLVVDTGSTAALHLDQAFAARHALLETLEVVGSSQSRGVGPGVLRNEIVRIPALSFGAHVLAGVPAHVEAPGQERGVSSGNLLGMQVLGRFHAFLDLERMEAFLEPAAGFAEPFAIREGPSPRLVIVGAGVLAAAAVVAVRRARRRRLAG